MFYTRTNINTIDELNDKFGKFNLNTTKTFYKNNKIIGYVDYFVIENSLYIKNMVVSRKRNGYGTDIVLHILSNNNIIEIIGYSINKYTDEFWKSLGCKIDSDGKFILNGGG
ncbi:UNVERIFIED_ORG: hypothetical protein B2H93_16830 [Clostridium botulinum]